MLRVKRVRKWAYGCVGRGGIVSLYQGFAEGLLMVNGWLESGLESGLIWCVGDGLMGCADVSEGG